MKLWPLEESPWTWFRWIAGWPIRRLRERLVRGCWVSIENEGRHLECKTCPLDRCILKPGRQIPGGLRVAK